MAIFRPWSRKKKIHRVVIGFDYDFRAACEIVSILFKSGALVKERDRDKTLIYEKEGRCMLDGNMIRQFDIVGIEDEAYKRLTEMLKKRNIEWEDVA